MAIEGSPIENRSIGEKLSRNSLWPETENTKFEFELKTFESNLLQEGARTPNLRDGTQISIRFRFRSEHHCWFNYPISIGDLSERFLADTRRSKSASLRFEISQGLRSAKYGLLEFFRSGVLLSVEIENPPKSRVKRFCLGWLV